MRIDLTNQEWEQFVKDQVQRGRFSSPAEVVYGALTLLQAHEPLKDDELEELRATVAIGIEQADRGELTPWNPQEIMDEVERRFADEQAKR